MHREHHQYFTFRRLNGTSNTALTSAASTGAIGDILRLEAAPGGVLTCYKNGVSTLTPTDTAYSSGQPGLFLFGTTATSKNWSGGNLRPLAHLDVEQDWTKAQHFTQGIALGGESISASPRGVQSMFLPGALTSTWFNVDAGQSCHRDTRATASEDRPDRLHH